MAKIDFSGRVAIVTGAGAGLGRTYALELASRGAKVVVNDLGGARDGTSSGTSAADQVVEEIKAAGGEAAPSYDSVATMEGGKSIVQTAVDSFGKVDILVNNAGILRDKSFLKTTEEDWDIVIAVHLKGTFCVTQPAFAVMKENKYGRIVNTSSASGLYGNFGQTNYAMAKTGMLGLMHSINVEGAKYNITCNTLAPMAASRLTEDVMPAEILERLSPELVAPLVVYLVSEENQDTNMIFNAGGGWFSRSALLCGSGRLFGDSKNPISAEEIRESWDAITSLKDAKYYPNANDLFVNLEG